MKTFDATYTAETLVRFLKTSFEAVGFQHTVIALSGGVDSSTSGVGGDGIGENNVYPLLLPYGKLNGQGVAMRGWSSRRSGYPKTT